MTGEAALGAPGARRNDKRKHRLIDLFAGCGGLTAGFVGTGTFEPVVAVESDLSAAATYAANFGEHVDRGDVRSWTHGSMPRADVVIGGPPCQGFSNLGPRVVSDARNDMWTYFVDVVARVRPAFFVMENVPQFLKSAQFALMSAETARGGRLWGWRLEPHLLDAHNYGAAQRRRRAIIVGSRLDVRAIGAPAPTTTRRTVADALKQLEGLPEHARLPQRTTAYSAHRLPGAFSMAELHFAPRPTAFAAARYSAVPYGGSRINLPDEFLTPGWRRHQSGAQDVMGRLVWEKPSVTIRTEFFKPEKGRFLHPEKHRPITHLEAALLQGFPEDYLWCGTSPSIARQIGNAVPVALGGAVAEHLAAHLH